MEQQTPDTTAPNAAPSPLPVARPAPARKRGVGAAIGSLAAFLWWLFTGFGLFGHILGRRGAHARSEEIVVYSVPRSFYLWPIILTGFVGALLVKGHEHDTRAVVWGWVYVWVLLYTFVGLLFDIGTLKFLLWTVLFAFAWLIAKYLQELKHLYVLTWVIAYFRHLRPSLDHGFALVMSWLLLLPWVSSLFRAFVSGRKVFSPNGIEEYHFGEGHELTDRSGLKFRSRYRDLFESILGFGAGDLEATDGAHQVVKRWENILFLLFVWPRLDEILHQRAAIVDNAPEEPVEVEDAAKKAAEKQG